MNKADIIKSIIKIQKHLSKKFRTEATPYYTKYKVDKFDVDVNNLMNNIIKTFNVNTNDIIMWIDKKCN